MEEQDKDPGIDKSVSASLVRQPRQKTNLASYFIYVVWVSIMGFGLSFSHNTLANKPANTLKETITQTLAKKSEHGYHVSLQTEYWIAEPSGHFGNQNNERFQLDDLGFGSDGQTSVELLIEHPLVYLPNFRMVSHHLEFKHHNTLAEDIRLTSQDFAAGTRVNSEIDLSHVEITAYYLVLPKPFRTYLGVSAKNINGELAIRDETSRYYQPLNETIPLVFLSTVWSLPNPNWRLHYYFSGASQDKSRALDVKTQLNYQNGSNFTFSLGYRRLRLELNNPDEINVDVRGQGAFIGIKLSL